MLQPSEAQAHNNEQREHAKLECEATMRKTRCSDRYGVQYRGVHFVQSLNRTRELWLDLTFAVIDFLQQISMADSPPAKGSKRQALRYSPAEDRDIVTAFS